MVGGMVVSEPATVRDRHRDAASDGSRDTGAEPEAASRPVPRGARSAWIAVALLALSVAAIVVVDPRGDFPLNDDWSFAASARRLFLHGDWRPLGWASMTQVTQALLGLLVCAASSCSSEHLRAGTLAVGAILVVSTYALLRTGGGSRLFAALGAVATSFNPVVYPLFYTFMTDVPFQLSTVLAALACRAALRSGRWRHVASAASLIGVATLSRQLGIAMAMAFLPVFWWCSEESRAGRAAKAAAPLAFCTAILLTYETWMRRTGRLPALYDAKYAELAAALSRPLALLTDALANALASSLYLGLFCLPVLLAPNAPGSGTRRGPAVRLAWGWTAAAALLMLAGGTTMPLLGNVLNRSGNGPLTLRDVYVLGRPDVPELPGAFWLAVSGLGLAGAWLLVRALIALALDAGRQATRGRIAHPLAVRLFAALATILYLLPLLPGGPFDRYLAVIAPVLCLAVRGSAPCPARRMSWRAAAACAYTAGLAAFSIAAAHDYLSWNRARWQAVADVEASRAGDARTLDGGFEYNGERSYDPGYVAVPGKSWWWVADDALQLSFAPLPGTAVVRRYPYATYLPPDTRSIDLLRRAPP